MPRHRQYRTNAARQAAYRKRKRRSERVQKLREKIVFVARRPCHRQIGPFHCCTVEHGDARELLAQVPTGAVDSVITDPPYGVQLQGLAWDSAVPYGLLQEFLRVATGSVVWFGAAPRMIEAAKHFDPSPQRILSWSPVFTLSHVAANGMAYRYHPIYTWRLPKKHDGPTRDVLTTNTETGAWWDHPCTKPVALMADLCGLAPDNAVILDPFAGSGTTLVAAQRRGRHFLGFEINREHVATARERLSMV